MIKAQQTSKGIVYFDILTMVVPIIILIVAVLFVVVFPATTIARLFHDDSFFYIKTAYNISKGMGSTFDGINPTNGYHPLYMILLSVLSYISPLIGSNGIYTVFILDMIMMVFALIIIDMLLKYLGFIRISRLLTMIGLVGVVAFTDFGMEVKLLLFITWLFIFLVFKLISYEESHLMLTIGILGAFICLARLDAIIFVAIVSLCASFLPLLSSYSVKTFMCLKRFIFLFIPSFISLILYALYNWTFFSRPMSISSWLKFGWPGTFKSGWFFSASFGFKIRFISCFVISILYLALFLYLNRRKLLIISKNELLPAILSLCNIAYLLVILFFHREQASSWYCAFPLSASVVIIIYLFESIIFGQWLLKHLDDVWLHIFEATLILFGLLLVVLFASYKIHRTHRNDAINIALWIKENLPQDAHIYQVDASGFTAYFSERSVINGDGIINGWEYQRYLHSNALPEYLRKYKVDYILWDEFIGEEPIRIPIPLWDNDSQILTFSKKPEQIIRFGRFVLLKPAVSSVIIEP